MTGYLLQRYLKESSALGLKFWLVVPLALSPVVLLNAWMIPGGSGSLWATAAMTMMMVSILPQRPTAFESALPIPAKSLALAKFLYALFACLLLFGIGALFSYLRAPDTFSGVEALESVLLVIIAVLLPRMVKVREFAVKPASTALVFLLPITLAPALIFNASSTVSLLTLFVITMLLGTLWWRSIPATFQAAPIHAGRAGRQPAVGKTNAHSWQRMLLRLGVSWQRMLGGAFLIFIGYTGQWWNAFMLFMNVEALWHRTRFLSALPVSHRARLWMLIGPGTVAPIVLLVFGSQLQLPWWNFAQSLERGSPSTYKQEPKYFSSPTGVGMEYWEKADGESAPTVTAPWGETVQPYVVRVLGSVYYNPFTARKASSQQFTDWQFERLTLTVYGRAISRTDYNREGMQPRRTTESLRMMVLNIATAFTIAFLLNFGAGIARMHQFWNRTALAATLSFVFILGPMLAAMYVMFVQGAPQGAINCVIPLIERQLLQLSAALPTNILAVFAVAAVPVLASYTLLEWQFRHSEMTGPSHVV